MTAPQLQTQKYTYEEYLKLEEESELRHEFYFGEIYSMSGTTKVHNNIVFNTTSALKNKLKRLDEKCNVFFEAIKVQIKEKHHYTYPDVVVSCNESEDDLITIKNPIVIVEVLSDSTREYDKDQKFMFYKQIPSLKHYILVEQDFCFVTCYTKENDLWYHKSFSKIEDVVMLSYLKTDILVKDIYEDIIFEKKNRYPYV